MATTIIKFLTDLIESIQSGETEVTETSIENDIRTHQGDRFGRLENFDTGRRRIVISYTTKWGEGRHAAPAIPTLPGPTGIQEAEIVEDHDALRCREVHPPEDHPGLHSANTREIGS